MTSPQSFRNQFLIALPTLSMDYFAETVTLLAEHTDDGAFGFVINRETETRIQTLFANISPATHCPVLDGGPVGHERIFFLHDASQSFETTFVIGDDIRLTTSADFIERLVSGEAPARSLAVRGYAGWGAQQLEAELAEDTWLLTPADADILFDVPFSDRASMAAKRLGVDLALMPRHAGHDQ